MNTPKKTVNITLKIHEHSIPGFEYWLDQNLEVIRFKIVPDTEELYNSDETFKKLVKNVKKAERERNDYINKYNKPSERQDSKESDRPAEKPF